MDKPKIITLDGKEHEMRALTGRDWRILGEFIESAPEYGATDFLERHAEFTANFFPDVSAEDILDLPLEEIFPLTIEVRNYITARLGAKLAAIEKNSEAGKAQ